MKMSVVIVNLNGIHDLQYLWITNLQHRGILHVPADFVVNSKRETIYCIYKYIKSSKE